MGSEISKMITGTTSRYMSLCATIKDIKKQRVNEGFETFFII